MKAREILSELEAMGTAQNRKVYARHGVQGKSFGVSYANLGKLRKKVGVDHAAALELWSSGNHDARVFATMIADPDAMTAGTLDAWARDLGDYVITDAFSGVVARGHHARKRMEKWTRAKGEWTATAGWNVLARLASSDEPLDDGYLLEYVQRIESEIHGSKNRARYSMNNALIAIGMRNPVLEREAVAAAGRIGRVEVDHGETGCKTPDAASYIAKTLAHRKKRPRAKA